MGGNKMNVNEKNTVFITVAAWQDWMSKMDVFLRSAEKQGIEVELLDKAMQWYGYYQHKVVRLRDHLYSLTQNRTEIQYIIFTDARDVVFIKPKPAIFSLLNDADDEKVLFALDNKLQTWPMPKTWLAHRIALKFGIDGIANSGCYAGRIDRVIALLSECMRIHCSLELGDVQQPSIESMLYNEIVPEYLSSDQFHIHAVQALWSNLIAVDHRRQVFACFKDGFPRIKTSPELGSNGSMPWGEAGILHSPWMLHRKDQTVESAKAWRQWAVTEGIIDEK
jgi:hypothetical protein